MPITTHDVYDGRCPRCGVRWNTDHYEACPHCDVPLN